MSVTSSSGIEAAPPSSGRIVAVLNRLRDHAAWIWLLGVLVLGMRLAWGNYLFGLQLRRRQPVSDPVVLAILEECRQRLGLRSVLEVIEVPELDSPALFGCFHLKLLLPDGLLEKTTVELSTWWMQSLGSGASS